MLRNVRDPLVYFHIRWLRKLNRTGGCLATSASDLGQFPQSRPLNSTLGGLRDWTARCRCCYQSSRWSVVVSSFPGPRRAQSEYLHPGRLEGRQQRGEAGGQPCWKGGPKHRDKIPSYTLSHPPPIYRKPSSASLWLSGPRAPRRPPALMRG